MNVTDDELLQGLDRIASTSDGELLYLYLQRVLCEIPVALDVGTLQANHGRRSLAAELMARMGKGIEASGGRELTGGTQQRTERPVVFRRVAVDTGGKPRSARDYLRANDPEYIAIAGRDTGG